MLKIFASIIISVFLLNISTAIPVQARMVKPSKTDVPPMSTEDDGYNPNNNPLPGWLLLPDGVDENSLTFSGDRNSKQTIKQKGAERWVITNKKNGASLAYAYYENNKLQYVIKTNKDYEKFIPYTVKNKKLQKNKKIDAEDYFDSSKPISFEPDHGITLFKPVSARTDFHIKRVSSKLTRKQIDDLNHSVGFKGKDASIANKVAWYESKYGYTRIVACEDGTPVGFNPVPDKMYKFGASKAVKQCMNRGAVGAGRGLYQLSTQWHNKKCNNKCAFSPEKSAKYAYKVRKQLGWTQWCSYGGPTCGSTPAGAGPAMQ